MEFFRLKGHIRCNHIGTKCPACGAEFRSESSTLSHISKKARCSDPIHMLWYGLICHTYSCDPNQAAKSFRMECIKRATEWCKVE